MHRFLLLFVLAPLALVAQESVPTPATSAYRFTDLFPNSSFDNSRSKTWQPGEGIPLEVGGMAMVGPDRLAVAIRKGEVWFVDGVHGAADQLKFSRFASGLHEPLGLLVDGDDLLVSQRSEITRLQDRDNDGVADAYLTAGGGWNVSGSYHAYVYGPDRGPGGKLWATLNLDMGDLSANGIGWRGWGGTLSPDGRFVPQSSGMRSPSGLGANAAGDLFFTDQQGTWIPATPIHHLRPGVFYGNQEALATHDHADAPFKMSAPKANILYPEATRAHPRFVPPAIWLPYNKMGRSATDLERVPEGFGPFADQLLVGEFTNAGINRLFLEKVNGQYQGACFRFLDGFPSAVMRLKFSERGRLFVGMTNRGWSSLGDRAYGLYRVDHDPKVARFDWLQIEAHPRGFTLSFTGPVDAAALSEKPVTVQSFTYTYSRRYGGPEQDHRKHPARLVPGDDPRRFLLEVDNLREGYVYEFSAAGLRSAAGDELPYKQAWYTLNARP